MAGNNNCGTNSRRQSNVPRCNDSESVSSLQGSLKRVVEYSPKSSQRKQLNRTPLYLSENSRTTLEQTESLTNTDSFFKPHNIDDCDAIQQYQLQQLDYVQKKPFAMVRPRRIVLNDEYRSFLSQLDLNYNVAARLRESKSLDLIPCNQLRNRIDSKRAPITNHKINDRSACSLDAGVSMISRDPMPEPFNLGNTRCNFEIGSNRMICAPADDYATDTSTTTNKLIQKTKSPYKALNNCNGPTTMAEDAHCPLLYRQNSLNNPQDETVLQHKRWRSLETVQHNRSDSETSVPKNVKNMNRGSIRSWLVNLFHGNGFSDASLRKTGVVQNRVKGFSGFGELPPAPEHESIV